MACQDLASGLAPSSRPAGGLADGGRPAGAAAPASRMTASEVCRVRDFDQGYLMTFAGDHIVTFGDDPLSTLY